MKTKNFFFALVLFFSLVFKGEAQTITETANIFTFAGSENSLSLSASADREYIVAAMSAGSTFHNGDGYYYVFHRNTDKTYSNVAEGLLPKGTSGAAGTVVSPGSAVVSNNGNSYITYNSTIVNGQGYNPLMKNGVQIHEFIGGGPSFLEVIDNYLYMTVVGQNSFELWKIDENTNAIIYQTSYPAGIGRSVTSIQKMPDGNLAIGFLSLDGNSQEIQKFNENNGSNIGALTTIDRYAGIKFANGKMEYITNDALNRGRILEGENFDQLVNETNFPVNNFFEGGNPFRDWKIINGMFYGVGQTAVYTLDEKLRHGYKRPLFYENVYGQGRRSYVYDENEYIFIVKDGDNYSILNIVDDGGDPVATVNLNHPDIVDGRDGMTYDGGWIQDYSHVSTLVFSDNNLPSVGDTPDENWLTAPTGFPVYGATTVRDTIVNNKTLLLYDTEYHIASNWEHPMRMRIFLKSETQLSVDDVLDVKTVIYPNPTNEILNLTSSQKIENITIYNTRGQKIIEKEYEYLNNDNEYQINISKLTKGTYFARIKGKFGVKIRKFVVK